MNILLTGGTGFVGQAIRKVLNKKNEFVSVLSRKNVSLLDTEKKLINTDLLDLSEADFKNLVKPFDKIIHAAWYVNPKDYTHSFKNIDFLNASLKLSRAVASYENKTFIGLGTCLEYDLTPGTLYPHTPEKPINLYSACKLGHKNITKEIFKHTNNQFIWARLFYLYGEKDYPQRLYPSVMRAIKEKKPLVLSNGNNVRDFIEVNTAAEMIVNCLLIKEKFKVVNISSGRGQSIKDFVKSIAGNSSYLIESGSKIPSRIEAPVIIGGQ